MSILSRFFTAAVLKLVLVNVSGGGLFGIVIGYVAVYTTLDADSRSCDKFESEKACHSVSHSVDCTWNETGNACEYTDTEKDGRDYQCKIIGTNKDLCKQSKYCYWEYKDGKCMHEAGMDSVQLGIYAGGMTIGGMFGSFTAGPLAGKFGRKWCIVCFAFAGLVGSIIIHIARGVDVYALHVLGRVFLGIASGAACVLSPMYVEEMAPDDMKGVIGTTFQASITTGIFLAALLGLIVEPTDMKEKQNYEGRIQGITAVQTFLCLFYMFMGWYIPESVKYIQLKQLAAAGEVAEDEEKQEELADDAVYSLSEMFFPLGVATFMCLVQQLTGINAIMNYAPKMTNQLGMRPMLGNFLIMLWNCITSFMAPPVSSLISLRMMFLLAVGIAFVSLILVGIPTYPKVTSKGARQGFGLFGIFLFILVFEIGMGPPFYVLCMQLFPYTFRNKGSAYSNGTVFIFNLIINVFYPICVTAISGGPSGDQNRGMAWCFFFFAACAFVSFFVCLKWLFPFYDSPKGKEALEACAARRATQGKLPDDKNNQEEQDEPDVHEDEAPVENDENSADEPIQTDNK